MEPRTETGRLLHEEHLATMALLNRLQGLLAGNGPASAPDASAAETRSLLADLAAAISGEVEGHFAFEEEELFPRLAEAGEGEMGAHLKADHEVMLPVGRRLAELAWAAAGSGFTDESWAEFHRLGAEFAERLVPHIQMETMGLVPMVDDILDEETDRKLASGYAASR